MVFFANKTGNVYNKRQRPFETAEDADVFIKHFCLVVGTASNPTILVDSAIKSLDFYVGVGQGFGFGKKLGAFEFEAGMYGDYLGCTFDDGEFTFGQRITIGGSATIGPINCFFGDVLSRKYGGPLVQETKVSDLTISYSKSVYLLFIGGTIEANWNLEQFVDYVWESVGY